VVESVEELFDEWNLVLWMVVLVYICQFELPVIVRDPGWIFSFDSLDMDGKGEISLPPMSSE
jgi:hypothetical protein